MADDKNIKKLDDALELLEKMSLVGRKNKIVDVTDQFKIKIETLSSEDESEVFVNTSNLSGSEYFTRHKIETIVHSICDINGKPLKEYEKIDDDAERKKIRVETLGKIRDVVGKWNDNLISFVYAEFLALVELSEAELVKIGIMKEVKEEEPEKVG